MSDYPTTLMNRRATAVANVCLPGLSGCRRRRSVLTAILVVYASDEYAADCGDRTGVSMVPTTRFSTVTLPGTLRLLVGCGFAAAATVFVALATFRLGSGVVPAAVAVATAGLTGVVVVDAGRREFRDVFTGEAVGAVRLEPADAADALAVVVAGPVTYAVSVWLGQGPVVASALVGLFAALALGDQAAPAYCGSFVGMVSTAVLPTLAPVAAASLVAGLVFVASKRLFDGFGGKLGTTAFLGCAAVVAPSSYTYAAGGTLSLSSSLAAVVAATAGAVAAFLLSVRFDYGAVIGSGTVGLVVGVLAPPALGTSLGGSVAAAAFSGSFIGMVSENRLPSVTLVGIAGLASGVVFVGVEPFVGGSGGKLGTIAFAACLLTWAVSTVTDVSPTRV